MADGYPFTSALVTGASSGIGEAMVRRLADAGVRTVVVARRLDRLEALAGTWPDLIEVLAADLATSDGVDRVADRLVDRTRPIDLLVNNAGFGTSGSFAELPTERVAGEIAVNVTAVTLLTRAALPGMIARERGWVCNVSSVASFQAAPALAVYAATKAFVTSFSESLHEELRGTGVSVTALCPGLTRTEFQQVSNSTGMASSYPSMMWLTADQVARAALADTASRHALSIPGLQYQTLVTVSGLTPRFAKRRIAGLITRRR